MRIENKAILLLVPVLFLTMATVLFADYAQTVVYFTVSSSTAFRVTLPGIGPVSSNSTANPNSPATDVIGFNSSTNTKNNLVPCEITSPDANCQTGEGASGTPIFQYFNIGTTNISIVLIFNSTLPTGVTVRGNSSWNKTSLSNGTGFFNGSLGQNSGDFAVNDTSLAVATRGLDWQSNSFLNVYLYSNFSSVAAGKDMRVLNHTST